MTPTDAELVDAIKAVVAGVDSISLGSHLFDRLPCSRRKVYALCRKHAADWGYRYEKAEYVASGNRAFKRNHKRGYRTSPHLFRRSNG